MKKIICSFCVALFLVAAPFLTEQTAFAGQPACNAPQTPICAERNCNRSPEREQCDICRNQGASEKEERQFAAAQIRYEHNRPPAAPLDGGESSARAQFSSLASVSFLFVVLWTLFILLGGDFLKRRKKNHSRLWNFALKPSVAMSVLGLMFAAMIIGSALTAPVQVSAEKRKDSHRKQAMVGADNPSNKAVFRSPLQIGGTKLTQIGTPVFDTDGNQYVRGGFSGTLQIGATTLTASRDFDSFVAKYSPSGAPLWARQGTGATGGIAAGLSIEGATALAVDSTGNVYIGGSFVKTLTLQGGTRPSVTLTDAGGSKLNFESFVAKYDAVGNLQWARGGKSNSPQNADNLNVGQNAVSQIVFDNEGNPYVTGFVAGSKFIDAATEVSGETDILLAKLNPANGSVVWQQLVGGELDDNGLNMQIDDDKNLYIIGSFKSDEITFPTAEPKTLTNHKDKDRNGSAAANFNDSINTFVAKFDPTGSAVWAVELDNAEGVQGNQIAVNGAGDVYLTGEFSGDIVFPTEPEETILSEDEVGTDESDSAGFVAKMNTDGDFLWAKSFGGVGEGVALDGAGANVYLVGKVYDGGAFGVDTGNEEEIPSFGGSDLFVARYDADGNYNWAKTIVGSEREGLNVLSVRGEYNYQPLGIAYNPARGAMYVAGDFQKFVSLDCATLTAPQGALHSYVAELSDDAGTCRIWNGLDADDNDWDSPDNWNGDVRPSAGDSVYVPYTGYDDDSPTFNPATNTPLTNLAVADDRIVTLEKPLTVNRRLDLLGGFVDAESFPLLLGAAARTFSSADGLILGTVQKQFAAGGAGAFTFPVGTADSNDLSPKYSPVTLSNIAGSGTFSVAANEGAYPNQANGLPMNRANRWWNLTNGGLSKADVTFQYLPGDIPSGTTENGYRAYRIDNGTAMPINSQIDTTAKTVTAPNVTQFSPWTLAQAVAPTAASVTVGGRVTEAKGRGIAQARVTLTAAAGNVRVALTNAFGYYRFDDVAVGASYIFGVSHKRYRFFQPTQVQDITEERDDINFTALR